MEHCADSGKLGCLSRLVTRLHIIVVTFTSFARLLVAFLQALDIVVFVLVVEYLSYSNLAEIAQNLVTQPHFCQQLSVLSCYSHAVLREARCEVSVLLKN